MFFINQEEHKKIYYKELVVAMGKLSRLFSNSNIPYIPYRAHENLFCYVFDADNLSRDDSALDAKKADVGIGLKTFIQKGQNSSLEKIAEFNMKAPELNTYINPYEKIDNIAMWRNERLRFAKELYGVNQILYHCLIRTAEGYKILEESMDVIERKYLDFLTEDYTKSLKFTDGRHEYSFNNSKNTLYKKFNISANNIVDSFSAETLIDPINFLEDLINKEQDGNDNYVILPLYSTKDGDVPQKSGLNQWNAGGRARDFNEIYIPIPAWIHRAFPHFFPTRDEPFELMLPDRNVLNVKVCQAGGKALMSNPNNALGEWLLRRVLAIPQGQLVTIDDLKILDIDCVKISQNRSGKYSIDFMVYNSYNKFKEEHEGR